MGDLREENGVVLEHMSAEKVALEIIQKVQPTAASEDRRRHIICFVQRLLKSNLGCEVFPFGSVPLKTYLPDGDIDLTVFCSFDMEETFANNVSSVLEREGQNPSADFVVKDVQYIPAEVKLVKCLIQNIVVDISFNQIGGLSALCFLEEVLHKFLDYFSKFDWEKYCVGLDGAILVSSLPKIVAERPDNEGGDLLLNEDFMEDCMDMFFVPSRRTEINVRIFLKKHLNIVDPLLDNNNLGRSVSKGNLSRIKSALKYGAQKLVEALLQSQENVEAGIQRFFINTLTRHGQGQGHRPDVPDIQNFSGQNGFVNSNGSQSSEHWSDSEDFEPGVEQQRGNNKLKPCSISKNGVYSSSSHGEAENLLDGVRDLRLTSDGGHVSSSSQGYIPYRPYFHSYYQSGNEKIANGFLNGRLEFSSLLPDLGGDIEIQLTSLHYGQWWYDIGDVLITSHQPVHQDLLHLYRGKTRCDMARQYSLQDMVPHVNVNGVAPRFYSMNTPSLAGGWFAVDEMSRTRGTGTFFPIMSQYSYKDRFSRTKVKTQGQVKSSRHNGRNSAPRVQVPVNQGTSRCRSMDNFERFSRSRGRIFRTNSFVLASERAHGYGAHVPPSLETMSTETESSRTTDSSSSYGSHTGEPVLVEDCHRLGAVPYHLKNDDDFPPLSC